ncbi:hypothetical protein [Pseudoalteromonas sp. TB64]|uniref:hypothetical protein n=1 Tax=Pseudoalteromonas sp. TB64 TaxID=1938600 RepID=UPI0004170D9F|nr:hypothetical protein [Pseudoalteromonas sp. TB64]
MNRTLTFLLILCFLLTACSKPSQPYNSFEEAQSALEVLNSTLVHRGNISKQNLDAQQFAFTDAYLTKRHAIYQRLMEMQLTQSQVEQVNYMVIAERFPERYFSWPAQINVLENMLALDSSEEGLVKINNWLKFTQNQLDSAKQSNLKLNKTELALLQVYISDAINNENTPEDLQLELTILDDYLTQYKPRGSAGLRGLANGSEWYQSKLNYFSGAIHSPLEWVTLLDQQIKMLEKAPFSFELQTSHEHSFLVQFLEDQKPVKGLDWLTGFTILPVMANENSLSVADRTLMLALMETDVGIHYHAWTIPQARVNLMKRLKINEKDAQYLVDDIILYPAQIFSFVQQIL